MKLGQIIETTEYADAIHVAVYPAQAGEQLIPGTHVGLNVDGTFGRAGVPIGIVDPFLRTDVERGQRFWLLLYQNTVTTLRHVWQHPAFTAAAEAWLREFAEERRVDFETLINSVGGDICLGTTDTDIPAEFWEHLETYTGKRFLEAERENTFFSCSC